ncbi:hypothetical protein [Oryza sativa Japonica Group]|uniref:Os01g0940650 protein n=2 Tax=Oryza sativa subsp. japonica TaxID=39947 RepID=Q5JKM0_ORYSJ|nr:hypothetical protein [Oryza sativa Japonica Group]BAS76151.1 Os01g0940650 [Oryza sativa Japonica Group]
MARMEAIGDKAGARDGGGGRSSAAQKHRWGVGGGGGATSLVAGGGVGAEDVEICWERKVVVPRPMHSPSSPHAHCREGECSSSSFASSKSKSLSLYCLLLLLPPAFLEPADHRWSTVTCFDSAAVGVG